MEGVERNIAVLVTIQILPMGDEKSKVGKDGPGRHKRKRRHLQSLKALYKGSFIIEDPSVGQ